jgi:small subunit ribosomal protein S16
VGKRRRPAYRVVVADARAPRDGAFIETIGLYDPLTEPATINIDQEKAERWLKQGAQPSETVAKLLVRQGVLPPLPSVTRMPKTPSEPKTKAKEKKKPKTETPETPSAPEAKAPEKEETEPETEEAPSKPKSKAKEKKEPETEETLSEGETKSEKTPSESE